MKKLILIGSIILLITACKSSKGHCDAYGNKSSQETEELIFDIHSSTNENMSKYVTTNRIK